MSTKLKQKIALITGGGSGIGRAAALLFAKQGAQVIVVDINGSNGTETTSLIEQNGSQATYINAHISKETDCYHMANSIRDKYGKLDIIVNNAGIMHYKDGAVTEIDEHIWDMTLSVNLKGTFLTCKHCIPLMIQAGGGAIVNISSFVALKSSYNAKMAYSSSKGALLALTRDLATHYAKSNIRVNSICPGPTSTETFDAFLNYHPDIKANYLSTIPLTRFGNSHDIAESILFLVSDESSFITGSNLVVDGGISCI